MRRSCKKSELGSETYLFSRSSSEEGGAPPPPRPGHPSRPITRRLLPRALSAGGRTSLTGLGAAAEDTVGSDGAGDGAGEGKHTSPGQGRTCPGGWPGLGQESTTRGGGGDGEDERDTDERDADEQRDGACDGGLQAAGATATKTECTPTMRVEAVTGPGRSPGRVGEGGDAGVRREGGSGWTGAADARRGFECARTPAGR